MLVLTELGCRRPASAKLMKFRPLLPPLTRTFPAWLLRRMGEILPMKALHEVFFVADILDQLSMGIWTEKKQAHAEGKWGSGSHQSQGRDILSLLRTV